MPTLWIPKSPKTERVGDEIEPWRTPQYLGKAVEV